MFKNKPKMPKSLLQEMPKKIGKIKSDHPKPTVSNGMKWQPEKQPKAFKSDRGNFGMK